MHRLDIFALLVTAALTGACATPDQRGPDEGAAPGAAATVAVSPAGETSGRSSDDSALVARADRSRILGDSAAPLWVVIVSDFQCPFCKVWHDQTFPALKKDFVDNGRVRLAYLNLPLSQHEHAQATAEMAMCAGAQGRFWEFHDALFDTQNAWSGLPPGTTYFDSVATKAKVDLPSLNACMKAHTMRAIVEADYQRAVDAKVRSTPTFFIGNDIRLAGAVSIEMMRDSITKALRAAATTTR
jgi:protein-disulfide isomerase